MAGKCVGVALAGLVLGLCACSSGTSAQAHSTTTTPSTVSSSSGAALSFRAVLGQIPYGTAATPNSCKGGRSVTAAEKQTAAAQIVLADREHSACYVLGPTLLTGEHIASADPIANESSGGWEVNVHFADNSFVEKVALPEVSKRIAIVLDGVVESAPVINPGITGRDVTISGDFDEATARRIAARLDPSSASRTPPAP